MGLFDAFKKKKEEPLELPAPPAPEEMPQAPEVPVPEEIPPVSVEEVPVPEHEEAPEEHLPRTPVEGPLFVSVQDYQAVLDSVNSMRSKLAEVDDSFKKLQDIKSSQEKELEEWRASLEDVQRKLTYVDEVLFGK